MRHNIPYSNNFLSHNYLIIDLFQIINRIKRKVIIIIFETWLRSQVFSTIPWYSQLVLLRLKKFSKQDILSIPSFSFLFSPATLIARQSWRPITKSNVCSVYPEKTWPASRPTHRTRCLSISNRYILSAPMSPRTPRNPANPSRTLPQPSSLLCVHLLSTHPWRVGRLPAT